MKISIDDLTSEDLERRALTRRVIIKLNGLHVAGAVLADDEEGYVDVLLNREHPNFTEAYRRNPKSWPTERRHGKVEIIDPGTPIIKAQIYTITRKMAEDKAAFKEWCTRVREMLIQSGSVGIQLVDSKPPEQMDEYELGFHSPR